MILRTPEIVWIFALAVILLANVPLLVGYASSEPPQQIFMGFDFIDDFHYYGSYIRSYQENPFDIFIANRMTSEPQDGRFFFPLFWVIGIISIPLGIPLALTLVRTLLGVALLVLVWHLLGHFFHDEKWRRIAFGVTALGGGVGWVYLAARWIISGLPVLYSSDVTYTLGYSLFGNLFSILAIAGQVIFLGMLLLLLRYIHESQNKYLVGIGIMGILLFFVHPISFITYVPVIIAGIVIAVLGNPTKETFLHIRKIAITGVLASIPIIIYLAWAFQDAVFEAVFFSYGSWLRSENPFWWFIGYGAILVFALYGIRHIQFDNHWKSAFFWGWVLAALILTLNPWKGLRFQPALFIPLVILGVNGLKTFIERDGKRWGNFFKINPMMLGVLFLLATLPSSGGVIYQHTLDVTKVSFQSGPYLSQSEIDAIQFLNTFERGVVLSSYKTGNNIAWMTHHIVYLGHWNQTLERGSKEADVQRFYSGGLSLNEMRHFLAEENIAYVFIGPEERLIGNPLLGWGEPIYRSEDILVLQVKH